MDLDIGRKNTIRWVLKGPKAISTATVFICQNHALPLFCIVYVMYDEMFGAMAV